MKSSVAPMPPMAEAPLRNLSRNLLVIWLVVVLVGLWCFGLSLTDPDEALYALIVRQMLATGDYVVPRLNEQPFLDRPILHYWLLSAAWQVIGESAAACRFVSLGLGGLILVGTWWLARDLFGSAIAWASVWGLAHSGAGLVLCLAVGHDTSLVAAVVWSMWFALRWQRARTQTGMWGYALGLALCLGLGILAKGLLGLVLPGWAWCWLWWLERGPIHWRSAILLLAGALLLPIGWYWAVELQVPGFLHYFFWERHIGGFCTTAQRHGGKSIVLYGLVLVLGSLPTALVGVPAWWSGALRSRLTWYPRFGRPRQQWQDSATPIARNRASTWLRSYSTIRQWVTDQSCGLRIVCGWWLGMVLFFCLAGSKNATYLLPTFPPLALLFGWQLHQLWHQPANQAWLAQRLVGTTAALSVGWLLLVVWFWPTWVEPEKSAETVIATLNREQQLDPKLPTEVWWFNYLPPSAAWCGPAYRWRRIFYTELQTAPTQPVWVVARANRVPEVCSYPFLNRTGKVLDTGKYTLFLCLPPAAEPGPHDQ